MSVVHLSCRQSVGLLASLAVAGPVTALAAGNDVVIGDIDDLSGVYSDEGGMGSAEAMKMAVADFGGAVLGRRIVTLVAPPQRSSRAAGRPGSI